MSATPWQPWLDKATEDLAVARLVLAEGHTAHACFLSQQYSEKALKACLLSKTNAYPRTHSLTDLLKRCEPFEADFARFQAECLRMDEFYIPTRYPDAIPGMLPSGAPSEMQAQNTITAAADILQFVTALLAQASES